MTTITALPTPPSRSDPANFATRADAFLAALPTFAAQTNAVATELNAAAAAADADAAAAAASETAAGNFAGYAAGSAAYKGEWSTLAGAMNIPASVSHNGTVYILKANAANVAAITPGVSNQWLALGTPLFSLPIFQANAGFAPASSMEVLGGQAEHDTLVGASLQLAAYANGIYVALPSVSGSSISSSPDLQTFTLRTLPATATWNSIGADDAAGFIATASSSTNCALSADGITWTAATALPASVDGSLPLVRIGGLWLVFVGGSSATYYTSTNGVAWTARTAPIGATSSTELRLLSGVLHMRAAGSANAYTTPDGINWTARNGSMPNTGSVTTAIYPDGSLWGAAGTSLYRTTDGFTWALQSIQSLTANNLPAEVGGVKLLLKSGVLYSNAGDTWVARAPGGLTSVDAAGTQWSTNAFRYRGMLNGRFVQLGTSAGKLSLINPSAAPKGLFTKV